MPRQTATGHNHYPGRHQERREQPQSSATRLPWTSTTTVQLRPPTWRTRWYLKCAHQRGGSHSAQTAGEGQPLHQHWTTRNHISTMGLLPGCSRILHPPSPPGHSIPSRRGFLADHALVGPTKTPPPKIEDITHGRRPSEESAGLPNTRSVFHGLPGEDTIQLTSGTLARGSKLDHTATRTQWAGQRNWQRLSSSPVPIGRRRNRRDRHDIQDQSLGRILANDCGQRGSLELLLCPARSSWPPHTCHCPIGTPNGLG
jgi:hypothetical protein